MSEKLTIIAQFQAKPGMEQALENALRALVEPSRAEPGCLNYDLHRENEMLDKFLLYENWVNAAALEHHFTMPYLIAFMEQAQHMLATPFSLLRLTMISEP